MENFIVLICGIAGYLLIGLTCCAVYYSNSTAKKGSVIFWNILFFWLFYHPGFNKPK